MDFNLYWLMAYTYRNGLIDRKEFIKHWAGIQALEKIMKEVM